MPLGTTQKCKRAYLQLHACDFPSNSIKIEKQGNRIKYEDATVYQFVSYA